jgi:hypothetical protein
MQLTVDVGFEPDLTHAGDVSRAGAETETIQHVDDGAIVVPRRRLE